MKRSRRSMPKERFVPDLGMRKSNAVNYPLELDNRMNTRQLKKDEVDKLREYYRRLEALIRDCLENDEFRLAWGIIKAEGRITHSSRKYAEQAGLACIRGLGAVFDGVGFAVWQNRKKTAWRIRFFAARQLV